MLVLPLFVILTQKNRDLLLSNLWHSFEKIGNDRYIVPHSKNSNEAATVVLMVHRNEHVRLIFCATGNQSMNSSRYLFGVAAALLFLPLVSAGCDKALGAQYGNCIFKPFLPALR